MRYLIYLILVVSTSLHAGAIHKWIDENDSVHYGDTPPLSTKTETIKGQPAPSNPGKSLPRLSTEQTSSAAGGDDDGDGDSETLSDEQARSICDKAQNELDIITSSDRIKLQQTDGGSRYLSDDEIAERRASAQSQVDLYCR